MKKNNLLPVLLILVLFFLGCKRDEYTITYHANGGMGNMSIQKFERGVAQALLPNDFICEGFRFSGWNTNFFGAGKSFIDEQIISIKSDMILYAQWVPPGNTLFVFFDANGGEGIMEPQEIKHNTFQNLIANTFTRTDHIFTGWNTKADGSERRYNDKDEVYLTTDITLYAQWVNPAGGGKPCADFPTVNDIDGNTYNTVQIGFQCWMRENLRTTKYNDGTAIPIIANNSQWDASSIAAMCYYNNDETNAALYGALYNGYAAKAENLCPDGWHVSTETEWDELAEYLGGVYYGGDKLKTEYGWIQDGNGNNESGFSAFPAGVRSDLHGNNFYGLGEKIVFWNVASNWLSGVKIKLLRYYSSSIIDQTNYMYSGYSIRCIKDE
jgi:uncharacterized protein (TIGR02145 family)/uncharacterized repeat protein (TIGR02543 family)